MPPSGGSSPENCPADPPYPKGQTQSRLSYEHPLRGSPKAALLCQRHDVLQFRVYSKVRFWDRRAETFEDQSVGPFINPVEHGFMDNDEPAAKIKQIEGYRQLFREVLGRKVTVDLRCWNRSSISTICTWIIR